MEIILEHWNVIDAILDDVLELPPDERAQYLDRSCGADGFVREYVDRLLRAEAKAPSFLNADAAQFAAPILMEFSEDGDAIEEDGQIGAYRLVRRIGRGGMGDVFLAERADGTFEQKVALKLLRGDRISDVSVQRFVAERQILASLSHPNIARVFDGGVAESGVLYLVMEYVDGQPIDQYCDAHRLTLRERILLVIQAAEAVQYANQNLVVHRDLKPSNILVDADGRVKLLDFGIAKLLHPDAMGEHSLTITGAQVMTPRFASPEQVSGEPITTASDVYQLGLLVYELVTGRDACPLNGESLAAIAQSILQQEPQRPSAVVARAEGAHSGELSSRRHTTPDRLARALRGDLDAIILKALRKDPRDRYPAAGQFADDLKRHLEGQNVGAHSGSLRYRARSFVRRNRWGVAAAATFTLVMMSYAVTVTIQARQLANERDRVRIEAEKAQQVTAFLTSILEAEDPMQAQGDSVSLRQVLEQASVRIRDELGAQPEVQAQLYFTTGRVYFNLGNLAAADSLLSAALALRRTLAGSRPSSEVADVLRELGRVRLAQGAFVETEALHKEALENQRQLHGGDHEDVASDLVELAEALRAQGRYEEAEPLYLESIAIYRRMFEGPNEGLATALNNLGLLYHYQWKYVEAGPLYREALAMQRALLGERHPYVATMVHNLAGLMRSIGRYSESDSLFRRVYAIDREVLGDNHHNTMASLGNLGLTLLHRGEYAEAEQALQRALSTLRGMLEPDHPSISLRLAHLALLYSDLGRFAEAESLAQEVHRHRVSRFGQGHPAEARSFKQIAEIHSSRGDHEEAERYYRRALGLHERLEEPSEEFRAEVLAELWKDLYHQGLHDEAEACLLEALSIRREVFGEDPNTAQVLTQLGAFLTNQGRLDEADAYFAQADSIINATLPNGNRYATQLALERVRLLLARENPREAERQVLAVRDWIVGQYTDQHPIRAELDSLKVASLSAQGREKSL